MNTASSITAAPAAGWFSDPHLPEMLRWWDGASWTEHVHPPVQPVAAAYPQPTVVAPTHHAQSYAPATQSYAPVAQSYASAAQSYAHVAQSYAPAAQTHAPGTTQAYNPAYAVPSSGSLMEANPKSMVAIGVSALYLLLALTSGIVVLGIFPALFTVRAFKGEEKLAPVALLATALAMGVALVLFGHRPPQ